MSYTPIINFDQVLYNQNIEQIELNTTLPLELNNNVSIQNASATNSGVVTTGAQTFAGVKTFNSVPICNSAATSNNELVNKGYVDTAISTHLSWKDSIISFYDFTTPPSSPSSGDRYIASSTVGDFTENYIYEYDGSAYDEIIPNEGDSLYVVGGSTFSDQCITYNGSSWVSLGSAVNHQSLIGAGTKTHSDLDNLWNGTTESSSTSTGQLVMSGGLAVQKNINIGGVQRIVNATDASSSASGCAIFSGGIGIQKKAYIGSDLNVTGVINANNDTESTSATTGALIVAGGLGTTKNIFCTGNLDVHNGINNTTIYSDIVRLTGSGDKVYIQPSNNAQTSGLWNDILFTPFILGGSPAFTISQNNITIHHSSLNTKTINISVDTNGDGLIDCSGNDLSFASTDAIRILNTNDATSTGSGSIICSGGIGITKKAYVGSDLNTSGIINALNTTDSTSTGTGSIICSGGIGIAEKAYVGSDLNVSGTINALNTTVSTSTGSGSIICSGGIGIAEKAYVGSDLNVSGIINANNTTDASSGVGSIVCDGGIYSAKNIYCNGNLDVHNGINSTTIFTDVIRLTGSGDKVYIQPSNNAQTSGLWNDILFTPFIQGGSPAFTISQNNITIHHSSLNTKTINISVDTNGDGLIDCSGNDLSFASTDAIRILNTNDATSSSTGALICSGGISIAKKLYISDTTSGSASSGSIVSLGGASFAKDIYCGGDLFVKNGLNATTIMSDVLRIQGQSDKSYIYPSNNDQSTGQWNDIIFALYGSTTPVFTIGEDSITINNGSSDNLNISVDDDGYTTFDASGNIINFHADNVVKVLNETDSTSTSTGGLIVNGGISASKQVYAGSNLVAATSVITPKIVINSGSDLDHYSTTTLNVASTTGSWTSGNALTGRITRVGNNVTITWNEVTDTLDDTNSGIVYVSAIPSTYRPTSTIEIFTKIVHNNIDEIGNMEITDAGYVNFSRFTSPQIFTTGICGYRSGTITYNII
jgi:hypothetical protein